MKKKLNTFGNCIFHVYGEETPLNRLLSFLAHRVTADVINLCKISYRSVKGLRRGGGPKIACSHRKAESSIILHCTTVKAVIQSLITLERSDKMDRQPGIEWLRHIFSVMFHSTGNGIPPVFNQRKSPITLKRPHLRIKHVQTADMKSRSPKPLVTSLLFYGASFDQK
jgi:hypothetical protein